jgi:hypothetical protein
MRHELPDHAKKSGYSGINDLGIVAVNALAENELFLAS